MFALVCAALGDANATQPPMRPDFDRDAHVSRIATTEDGTLEVRLDGVVLHSGHIALEIDDRALFGPSDVFSSGSSRRATATFDVAGLPWDGRLHAYVVLVDDRRFGPWFLALPEREERPWRWVIIVFAAAATIGVGFTIDRRRRRSATPILR